VWWVLLAMAIQRVGFKWLRQLKELGLGGYVELKRWVQVDMVAQRDGLRWIW
jgi:hypothetical protein